MINELLEEVSRRSFASNADMQRFVDARMHAYNARPQAELGGLSPAQMSELLAGDWSTTGPLRVNSALSDEEIGDPDLLHNAVAFLATLRDDGPAKATAAGNLSREFVGRMLERLRLPAEYLADLRRMNKVINEFDVEPLETLRYLLQFAHLIQRRKGFHISARGRALLDDARRSELLVTLFLTFFRQMDLRSLDGWDGDAGLQQTIAFTFWQLRTAAAAWALPAHLVDVVWLEDVKDPVSSAYPTSADARVWRLERRVLEPLVSFGLLESRDLPAKDRWERPIEVRKTPLYDRMLRFEFGGSVVASRKPTA